MKTKSFKLSTLLLVVTMIFSAFSGLAFAGETATTTVDIETLDADVKFTYMASKEELVPVMKGAFPGMSDEEINETLDLIAKDGTLPVETTGTVVYDASAKTMTFDGDGKATVLGTELGPVHRTKTLPVEDVKAVLDIDGEEHTATYDKATGKVSCTYDLPSNRQSVKITIKEFVADTTYNEQPGQVVYKKDGDTSTCLFTVNDVTKYTLVNPTIVGAACNATVNGTPQEIKAEATFEGDGIIVTYGSDANIAKKVDITVTMPVAGVKFSTEGTAKGEGVNAKVDVVWNAEGVASYDTEYTASIYIDAAEGYLFDDTTVFTVNGEPAESIHVKGQYGQHIITITAKTAKAEGGVSGFVERLYTVALSRPSDPEGKQMWIDAVYYQDKTGADIAKGFLNSDEFKAKKLSNSDFLDILYRTFFDREADAAGKAAWLEAMDKGASRDKVMEGFINSVEFANVCLKYGIVSGGSATPTITVEPNEQILDFVERLYNNVLGRSSDADGKKAWGDLLANQKITGTKCAEGFFKSPEFTSKEMSNEEFVDICYLTFLDRPADAKGKKDWVDAIIKGATYDEVVAGFAASKEFGKVCASYGIVR